MNIAIVNQWIIHLYIGIFSKIAKNLDPLIQQKYSTDFTVLQKFHFKKVLEIALFNVDWVNLEKKIENQFANPIFYFI